MKKWILLGEAGSNGSWLLVVTTEGPFNGILTQFRERIVACYVAEILESISIDHSTSKGRMAGVYVRGRH